MKSPPITLARLKENWKPIAVVGSVAVLVLIAGVLLVQLLVRGVPPIANPSPPAASPSPVAGQATPEPIPTSDPEASPDPAEAPTPSPTPYVATDLPLPDGTAETQFWARVLVDELRVRDAPGTEGTPVDAVSAGDVVMVLDATDVEDTTWYHVFLGGTPWEAESRWVAAGPPEDRYLARIGPPSRELPDLVRGIAAGPSGYLAWGATGRTTDWTELPLLLTSPDGLGWSRSPAEALGDAVPDAAAWGPGGWVVVSARSFDGPGQPVWRSADGASWEQVGADGGSGLPAGIAPYEVVGSDAGYAMTVSGDVPDGLYHYSSVDGRTWRPIDVRWATIFSTGDTLMALSPQEEPGDGLPLRLHRFDGGEWVAIEANEMPTPANPQWAASGNALLMIDLQEGSAQVWAGTVSGDRLEWARRDAAEPTFAGIGLSALRGGTNGFLALGFDPETMGPVTLSSADGVSWTRRDHGADAFGGAIVAGVRGPLGTVVLGSDPVPGAAGQAVFFSTDLETWTGQAVDPDHDEDLTAGGCPALPRDLGDLLGTDGAIGAACFGDAPITLRGYATDCGGCGGYVIGTYEPDWLAHPMAGLGTYLAPFEVDGGYGRSVLVHPDVADDWVPRRWLEVTGHFDDAASPSCRMTLDTLNWAMPTAADEVAAACRARFVVTAIEVVDGP